MPDHVMARDSGKKFSPHPEGQFAARCVDVIDLGDRWKEFPGSPGKITPVCALLFETGEINEEGVPYTVAKEFTVSMHEKSALRQFLESWRGKSYSEAEARAGVPLDKLTGHPALVSVEHRTSAGGRTYATFRTIAPLPKAMPAPELPAYTRADYWAERKAEYAVEVAKHAPSHAFQAPPPAFEDDDLSDDLPFSVGAEVVSKTCFKCQRLLPLPAFYAHLQMADGHLNKCKDCTRRDVQTHREQHREQWRAWDHRRYLNGRHPAPRGKPQRRAQMFVNNAIQRGKMQKPTSCTLCGFQATAARQIHAHHADYTKPLDVTWVCQPCHGKLHRMEGATA